ncbi:RtcB family protein [Candidatus Pacearchaeota archaeon]|nr:RtcB family protein [Candidatus Pacearchaeota archaeon]
MQASELVEIGYPAKVAGIAVREFGQAMGRGNDRVTIIAIAKVILAGLPGMEEDFPITYKALADWNSKPRFEPRFTPAEYKTWGDAGIEQGALDQMDASCSLPVTFRGALMPDAHQGYGLPIGGVLATKDCVIPYAVGVDIACRIKLSVFELSLDLLDSDQDKLKEVLVRETRFGMGCNFGRSGRRTHDVMDDYRWNTLPVIRDLRDTAWSQLGTSGGGNHFVEFGIYTAPNGSKRLALLSHSGSRGVGSKVAKYYSDLAMKLHPELPDNLKHLSWLDLSSAEGMEYWEAMQLMGRYAAANHDCIHEAIAKNLGAHVVESIENSHNFAWKEEHYGSEVIVHRKGATPAQVGVMGIIPGSMASPAYVVKGKGNNESLHSASHGAGRLMSRTQAKAKFNWEEVNKHLKHKGVTLISAGIDESPGSYKDIEDVMRAQTDLVEVVGKFDPKLVRMADD